MTDTSTTHDVLCDAAEWLLALPRATPAHWSAAATLLTEAARALRGEAALTVAVSSNGHHPLSDRTCWFCGDPIELNPDKHQDTRTHPAQFRADGIQWEWSRPDQAYFCVAAQVTRATEPDLPAPNFYPSDGPRYSQPDTPPGGMAPETEVTLAELRARLTGETADVSRETSPDAVAGVASYAAELAREQAGDDGAAY